MSGRTRPGWRGDWQITVAVAVLILVGVGALLWLRNSHHAARRVVLPRTLLGLSRASGQNAKLLADHLVADEKASWGFLGAPVAAEYRDSAGGGFAIVVGTPCSGGSCMVPTAPQAVRDLRAQGESDATSFPPGNAGGVLTCFSAVGQGIQCSWIDQTTAAAVVFDGRHASALADAAAKTRQIRDAIEN